MHSFLTSSSTVPARAPGALEAHTHWLGLPVHRGLHKWCRFLRVAQQHRQPAAQACQHAQFARDTSQYRMSSTPFCSGACSCDCHDASQLAGCRHGNIATCSDYVPTCEIDGATWPSKERHTSPKTSKQHRAMLDDQAAACPHLGGWHKRVCQAELYRITWASCFLCFP